MKKFILKYKNELASIFILEALSASIYRTWLSFSIFNFSDWWFKYAESLKAYTFPYIWHFSNFENLDIFLWRYPYNFLFGLLGNWGFNMNIAEKVLVFWPLIFILPLAFFLFLKKILRSNIGALIGALVFISNTYFFAIATQGHILITLAACFAILTLHLFISGLERKSKINTVICAILLFITGFIDFRIAYIIIWVLFFYAGYYFLIINQYYSVKNLWKNIKKLAYPILIFILLNLYWLLPQFVYKFLHTGILSRSLFGSQFWSLPAALSLFHPFWTGTILSWFKVQPIPPYLWLIPILAFGGLYLNRKNKLLNFFALLALLGIFLAKQADYPWSGSYQWLFDHLYGFKAFREASKFYFLIILGYAALIGSFIAFLWQNWQKTRWQIYGKYLITILVAILFLFNAKPIITGEIRTLFIPRQIPQDYLIFKEFASKQNNFFRILWVPSASHWSFDTKLHPLLSNAALIQNHWKNLSAADFTNSWPIKDQISNIYFQSYSQNLFNASSIKYVALIAEDKANDENYFSLYGSRDFFLNKLEQVGWLQKIDIGTEELVVYENPNFRPHFYTTLKPETIYQDIPYQTVDFQNINPTQYKIKLINLSSKIYLNFAESYHPEWSLRTGQFNWLNALWDKKYFLPADYHYKNDANLNTFLIDPEYIKNNYPENSYQQNPDSSIDLELTLFFKPQAYLYLGLIISGITLLLCLVYLGYALVKKKNEKS